MRATATGKDLDAVAEEWGARRQLGETDSDLRAQIEAMRNGLPSNADTTGVESRMPCPCGHHAGEHTVDKGSMIGACGECPCPAFGNDPNATIRCVVPDAPGGNRGIAGVLGPMIEMPGVDLRDHERYQAQRDAIRDAFGDADIPDPPDGHSWTVFEDRVSPGRLLPEHDGMDLRRSVMAAATTMCLRNDATGAIHAFEMVDGVAVVGAVVVPGSASDPE